MPITQALKEVYANPQRNVRYIETIELYHPNFPKTYYLTNDVGNWQFRIEDGTVRTFESVPFEIRLPGMNNTGQQEMQFAICNIGYEIIDSLEKANALPSVNIRLVYRVYLDTPASMPQNNPPTELSIADIVANTETITATATRFDVLNRKFPSARYNVSEFPGLLRG
jgi:hypothetical protein